MLFCLHCAAFDALNEFIFGAATVPYSASAAAPGKHATSPVHPREIAFSDLSDGVLMAELQLCLLQGQEAAGVLVERKPHWTKLAGDFVVVERANTRL